MIKSSNLLISLILISLTLIFLPFAVSIFLFFILIWLYISKVLINFINKLDNKDFNRFLILTKKHANLLKVKLFIFKRKTEKVISNFQ